MSINHTLWQMKGNPGSVLAISSIGLQTCLPSGLLSKRLPTSLASTVPMLWGSARSLAIALGASSESRVSHPLQGSSKGVPMANSGLHSDDFDECDC